MVVVKVVIFLLLFDVILGNSLIFPRARRDVSIEETCGPIEVYTDCWADCEPSCTDPNPTCSYDGTCVSGCVCPTGTLRDDYSGQCVTMQYCQLCPPGEQYSECGAACEPTCSDLSPYDCTQCQPGCLCSDGTVRDETTGECVLIEDC